MKAITTKYIGPTDYKGARIRVKAEGLPSILYHWNDGLNIDANHTAAAKAFAEEHEWAGQWCGGGLPDQTGNCYVRIPSFFTTPSGTKRAEWDYSQEDENNFYIARKDESK